jgi:6-phosphogluconate dehydrogenase
MVDVIADAAAQTGTGSWMVTEAMALGVPVPTVAEAVAARSLSAMTGVRRAVAAGAKPAAAIADDAFIAAVGDALLGSIVASHAQGFAVIHAAAGHHGWPVREAAVATIWRKGCIIQSRLLDDVASAYRRQPDLPVLLLDDEIGALVAGAEEGWRDTVVSAVRSGLPVPAMASALAWHDAFRSARLWTALTQAQRDLFGAHTYARTDRPGKFHTDWPEVE